jgi:hypothetical protein
MTDARFAEFTPPPRALVTLSYAAAVLGITPEHCRNLLKLGEIQGFNVAAGKRPHYVVFEDSIAEFIRRRSVAPYVEPDQEEVL